MNGNSDKGRNWRRKQKRGVSPIIATILLVAITVVLAAVLYILISGLTKGPGNTPIGTSLAVQTPIEAQPSAASLHFYNFSIQAAGGGLILNNLIFQVTTPGGQIVVTTAAGWAVNVLGITGSVIGTYAITSATPSWTLGGTVLVSSQQTIAMTTPAAAASSLSGDRLIIVGTGTFSGSISVSIP
ncbi:MAG TPA: archaellin/type IV pilin N-terminal domain-containing protein [Thermoplasmata archaeon]